MGRQNKSRYAILGILSLRPMSGYDIKKTIKGSLSNFWSESYGQIYPILKSLVEDGLATISVEIQTGKPNRHVYALTKAGREVLEMWLREPIQYEAGRSEILLKLFFGWQLPVEESGRKVEEFRATQQQLLDKYQAIEQGLKESHEGHPGLPYWVMTLSYGQHISRALTEWCDETQSTLSALAPSAGDASGDEQRSTSVGDNNPAQWSAIREVQELE